VSEKGRGDQSKIKLVPQATGPLSIVKLTLTATEAGMRFNRSREIEVKITVLLARSKAKREIGKIKQTSRGGGPLLIYVFQSASDHALRPERA
jgi:hypothetical protein